MDPMLAPCAMSLCAVRAQASGPGLSYRQDPLLCTVADRLLDRLEDCKQRSFKHVAVIGGAGA